MTTAGDPARASLRAYYSQCDIKKPEPREKATRRAGRQESDRAVLFTARADSAADWIRIKPGESIESAPMVQVEAQE